MYLGKRGAKRRVMKCGEGENQTKAHTGDLRITKSGSLPKEGEPGKERSGGHMRLDKGRIIGRKRSWEKTEAVLKRRQVLKRTNEMAPLIPPYRQGSFKGK